MTRPPREMRLLIDRQTFLNNFVALTGRTYLAAGILDRRLARIALRSRTHDLAALRREWTRRACGGLPTSVGRRAFGQSGRLTIADLENLNRHNEGTAMTATMQFADIESAPRDGIIFIARNKDRPQWGSWAMLRHVDFIPDDQTGKVAMVDRGAWLIVRDRDQHDLGRLSPFAPISIAVDEYNRSVNYEWMPLPGHEG